MKEASLSSFCQYAQRFIPRLGSISLRLCARSPCRHWLPSGSGTAWVCICLRSGLLSELMRANTDKMINVMSKYTLYSRVQLINRLNMVNLLHSFHRLILSKFTWMKPVSSFSAFICVNVISHNTKSTSTTKSTTKVISSKSTISSSTCHWMTR